MERENEKGKIVLTVVGVITLLVVLAGATFAYFSASSTTETRTVTTSNLNLTIAADGAATHVTDIKPTDWNSTLTEVTNNADIAKIPFKVTGTSSTDGKYVVNLQTSISLNTTAKDPLGNDVTLTGGDVSDIKYRLYTKDGTAVGAEKSFTASTDDDIVTDGAITANEDLNDEYILYIYIQNDTANTQDKLQNVSFTVTLGGSASQA